MSDRELLEFAAKAAGLSLSRCDDAVWCDERAGFVGWNPIDDDGDALWLMVRLRLEPRFIDNSHSNGAEPSRVTLHNFSGIVENIDGDPIAATRRAIVRAAAESRRQMK